METLKMFLVVEGKKDAHAGIPGPYCILFGATADQQGRDSKI
jgi:hypothetical protein